MGELEQRRYLGDGAYVGHDGFGVVLTTENGLAITNQIYLEPNVMIALITWWEHVKEGKRAP